ncbi:unnamed protein product, partial [Ostreobium quekettii]
GRRERDGVHGGVRREQYLRPPPPLPRRLPHRLLCRAAPAGRRQPRRRRRHRLLGGVDLAVRGGPRGPALRRRKRVGGLLHHLLRRRPDLRVPGVRPRGVLPAVRQQTVRAAAARVPDLQAEDRP